MSIVSLRLQLIGPLYGPASNHRHKPYRLSPPGYKLPSMRLLVWSEVRYLLDVARDVDELIAMLEQYRADPPLPR